MKTKHITLSSFLFIALLLLSCFKEESEIIHQSQKGSQLAIVTPGNTIFLLTDLDNGVTDFKIDTVGEFTSLSVEVTHRRTGAKALVKTIDSLGDSTVSVTLTSILEALEISKEELQAKDAFVVDLVITSKAGISARSSTSSYYCYIACESSIAGTYDVISNGTSTDGGAPGPAVDIVSEVTLTQIDGISYSVDNVFAGVYEYFYCDAYGYCFSDEAIIRDFCGEISGELTDAFGGAVWITGTIDKISGKITLNWENEYGDKAKSIYTPQSGK